MAIAENIASGYLYQNPDSPHFGEFEVLASNTGTFDAGQAKTNQAVIHDTLNNLYEGIFPAAYIDKMANPDDERLLASEEDRLWRAHIQGRPVYLQGYVALPSFLGHSCRWYVGGIGSTQLHDERPAWRQALQPVTASAKPGLWADIGNVFVRPAAGPEAAGSSHVAIQNQGLGSAILRSVLDYYPANMPTYVEDYPNENRRLEPVLRGLGFRVMGDRVERLAGVPVVKRSYQGPLAGELIEVIEAARPWLRDRQPVRY